MDSSSPLLSLFILLAFSCIRPLYSDPSPPSPSPPSPPPLPPPPPSSRGSFSPLRPSIVVIVTILTSLFGITFILLLYAKHCSHAGGSHGGYPLAPAVARKNSGIDRAVVESLPMFRFASLKGKKDGLECVVCLMRFEPTEALRLLPKCGHAFHVECVDRWLDAHSTCPLCRYRVDPEDILIPGRDIIIPMGDDDHEGDASAASSTSICAAGAGRTRRVSGRHSYAGEKARAFGESIRSVFAFRRSLDGNGGAGAGMSRKDGMLRTEADGRKRWEADRKVEHRIVVSDGKGGGEETWGLLYLESMMMMNTREEEERRRAMKGRSASAMAGIGRQRHDGLELDREGPPRSRSSAVD